MKTVKEQVEALAVTDTLKTGAGEEALGGEWEGAGGANTGKKTTTGWTMTAEKTIAAAKRKTATSWVNGGILRLEVAVLPAVGQTFELQFGVTGEAQKVGVFIRCTGAATAEVALFSKAAGSLGSVAGVALTAGDNFYLSWEPTTGKLTVWRKTGATTTEILSKTAEAPTASVKPAIFFEPEAVAGVAGRAANFGMTTLEVAEAGGSLAMVV